ncbi:hypothetical protein PCANC_09644 [Puccinia coronata f. sp. avenae]|nr:hypothetical protein PCANC_09644 [Puccinia coronata f. sp. avenae]
MIFGLLWAILALSLKEDGLRAAKLNPSSLKKQRRVRASASGAKLARIKGLSPSRHPHRAGISTDQTSSDSTFELAGATFIPW